MNNIPKATLFKYLLKDYKKQSKELNSIKKEYEALTEEFNQLKKKVPAYTEKGFISLQTYEKMAQEKNKVLKENDIWLSRVITKNKEIEQLKEENLQLANELKAYKTNLFE